MSVDSGLLRIELFECFEQMLTALGAFCAQVRHDQLPAWVSRSDEETDQGLGLRDKAVQAYRALWYEDGQDGRETLTCPGLVGASPATLDAAQQCNTAKEAFKNAVLALKKLDKAQIDALWDELHSRDETINLAMRRMGAARLNLKQAYRHIPILAARPVKVGFTWSKQGRTIERKSVAEVRQLLETRLETAQIRLEMERLSQIPETEMLARVRSVCPHLRANLVFATADGVERRLKQAPLPLLIPLAPGEPLPEFVPIAATPGTTRRMQRSDVQIEEELFLPSIRIHRYRPPYRNKSRSGKRVRAE